MFGLNPFVPTEARSYEGGVKANMFGGHFNVTAAYFDIKRKNAINTFTCPTLAQLTAGIASGLYPTPPANAPRTAAGALIPGSGTCANQLGGDRSRGVEFEVNTQPLQGLTITGGYAHTHARISASNVVVQNGARVTNSPDDAFNVFARYDFQAESLANFGLSVGVSHIGGRAGLLPTVVGDTRPEGGTLPLPSYTTVDAALYWKAAEHLNLTLKATNLFDERFIESAGFTGDIQLVPGTPRLLTLTARVGF